MDISRVLKDVPSEKAFWFNNGVIVRNIYELTTEISHLSDYYFSYHHDAKHDDFAMWIGGALGDIVLAERLRVIHNKDAYVRELQQRIRYLEGKYALLSTTKKITSAINFWLKEHDILLRASLVVLLVAVVCLGYVQYHSIHTLESVQRNLSTMRQQNACVDMSIAQRLSSLENQNATQDLMCLSTSPLSIDSSLENLSGRIRTSDVVVQDSSVSIRVSNVRWAVFNSTSSMLPILNQHTQALELVPTNESEIRVGDIISYRLGDAIIIHRVIDIGADSFGTYFVTKGDNNLVADPAKVRFDQIEGVVAVLIY